MPKTILKSVQTCKESTKEKTYCNLDFTDDFIFCKILMKNPELCKELLELIIGKRVEKIVYS